MTNKGGGICRFVPRVQFVIFHFPLVICHLQNLSPAVKRLCGNQCDVAAAAARARTTSPDRASTAAPHRVHATLISTALGFGFSAFGRWTSNTPSLKSAFILSSATSCGRENDRTNVPYERSTRW